MSYNGGAPFLKNINKTPYNTDGDLFSTPSEFGVPPSPPGVDFWLQQDGSFWEQQNGFQWVVLT